MKTRYRFKLIYLWIALIGAFSIVVSLLLIPSGLDIAYLQMKGGKFKKAKELYLEQYEEGNRSQNLIYSLSLIYEQEGELQKAIDIIKEYSATHPNDTDVLKRLAELYLLNHMLTDFNEILQKLEKMGAKLDVDSLRALSEFYETQEDFSHQERILRQIISLPEANRSDYERLINSVIRDKRYEEAAKLLEWQREHFSKDVNLESLFLELKVQNQLDHGGDALPLVADYLNEKEDLQSAIYAFDKVAGEYPHLLPAFIELIQPSIEKEPDLEAAILSYQWESGKGRKQTYDRLKQLGQSIERSREIDNLLFRVYLFEEDDDRLLELIERTREKPIYPDTVIDISTMELLLQKPHLVQALQKSLGESYLDEHPFQALALSVGSQEKEGLKKLQDFIRDPSLVPSEKYILFKIASAAHFDKEVLLIGKDLPPYQGLPEASLIQIAQTYVSINKAEILYQMIEESFAQMNPQRAQAALTLLDIVEHKPNKAAAWIEGQSKILEGTLNAYFDAASNHQEYVLALQIAKRLRQEYPSPQAESSYGLALVLVGKVVPGMEIIEKQAQEHPRDRTIALQYLMALVSAAKRDRFYAKRLITYMEEDQKKKLSKAQLRDFGYIYLDILHNPQKAKEIFWTLANQSSPKVEDLSTLLFLWGPNVSKADEEWIVKKSADSDAERSAFWLKNLVYIGNYKKAIEFFNSRSDLQENLEAIFAYLDALALLDCKPAMRFAINAAIPLATERKQQEMLALFAEIAEYNEARLCIWEGITTNNSEDPVAWQELARVQYDMRMNCEAQESLEMFFALSCEGNEKLFESLFEMAEVLRKERFYNRSDSYYARALEEISWAETETPRMREIRALSLFQLDLRQESRDAMRYYYRSSGRDPSAGASYANILMDNGRFGTAERFLLNNYTYAKEGCCEE